MQFKSLKKNSKKKYQLGCGKSPFSVLTCALTHQTCNFEFAALFCDLPRPPLFKEYISKKNCPSEIYGCIITIQYYSKKGHIHQKYLPSNLHGSDYLFLPLLNKFFMHYKLLPSLSTCTNRKICSLGGAPMEKNPIKAKLI